MVIRAFKRADFDRVRAIYQQGIDTKNATFQEQAKDWLEWNESCLKGGRFVAEFDGQVVGWASLSPVCSRCVYAGVAEVSVYVDEQQRGKGIGLKLLESLVDYSESHGLWTLQASIFPENAASILIHKKCNFREVGIREKLGCQHGVWRDVVFMERRSRVIGI